MHTSDYYTPPSANFTSCELILPILLCILRAVQTIGDKIKHEHILMQFPLNFDSNSETQQKAQCQWYCNYNIFAQWKTAEGT